MEDGKLIEGEGRRGEREEGREEDRFYG